MKQRIGFFKSYDRTRISYAISGDGPVVVRVGTWMAHIELDWESPIWQHWFQFLSSHHTLVRYDFRGCGLSDRDVGSLTFNDWVGDLEALVDHLKLEQFILIGMCQGGAVAIEYAARHPSRVKQLVIYGASTVGWARAPDHPMSIRWKALAELLSSGWGDDNPAFRSMFVQLYVPEASREQVAYYAELARKSASREVVARIMCELAGIDVTHRLRDINVPTLVIHISEDSLIPQIASQFIAEGIAGAEFAYVDSRNHILIDGEPGWSRFKSVFAQFVEPLSQQTLAGNSAVFAALTKREKEILTLVATGLNNANIADQLFISEKTVRNHLTNIFSKLDVSSRAQAIVYAKDIGL